MFFFVWYKTKTTTNADVSLVCKKDSLACWPTSGDRLNSVVSRCLSPWDGMVCRRPTNTTANHLDRWLPDFVFPFCSLTAAWLASPKMFRPLDMVGLCRKGVRFTVVFYLFIYFNQSPNLLDLMLVLYRFNNNNNNNNNNHDNVYGAVITT